MTYPVIRDKQNFPAFTTASTGGSNPYTNVPVNSNGETIWNTEFLATKIFTFVATTHDLLVKILGSQDGGLTFNKTPLAETSVAVGVIVTEPIPGYYSALRVQVKAAVAGTNGTLTASAIGTSLPDTENISVDADVNTAAMEALIGTKADAPASGAQTTAEATVIKLLKGMMNDLEMIAAQTPSNAIPYGATLVRIAADGAAGAAVSAIMPAVVGKKNYVLGYHVTVDTAATTGAMTTVLTDDATPMGTEVMASLSPIGTTRTQSASLPIMANSAANKTASIVCSAPGGATVIHATIWGYNL